LADLGDAEGRLKAELFKLDEQECTRRLLSELEAAMRTNKRSLHWCVEACTTLLNPAAADTQGH